MVERVGMSGKGQGKLRKAVDVDLWFVCASAHDPVAIFTDTDPAAGLFELEILEKLDSILVLWVVFQTALPLPRKPIGKRSRC